jgi:hypothetical protein
MYNLAEKYPKLGKGPNPFIDPEGYKHELDIQEHAFLERLAEQKKAVAHALLRAAFTPSKTQTLPSGMDRVDGRELNLKAKLAKFGG